MEVKLDKHNILRVIHHLKSTENYKISKGKKFDSISIFKKPQILKGVASYCSDGNHILLIDWDDVPKWLVKQDYKRLQEKYSLQQGYLFTTQENVQNDEVFGNYHIISLNKHLPKKIYELISQTHADVNFMSMPLRTKYRNWILRLSSKKSRDKPKFISLIGSFKTLCPHTLSKPHFDLLNKVYPEIKHPNYDFEDFDDLTQVFIQEYEAS